VSRERLRMPRDILTARQKSAEGVVSHVVGKASEALQCRKAEKQIGEPETMIEGPNEKER
jgi:hypothetical protein